MLNFRSFGGFESLLGGHVRDQQIFRGAAPSTSELLEQHGFHIIGDLRHPSERESDWPEKWAERRVSSHIGHSGAAPHLGLLDGSKLNSARVRDYYLNIYSSIPLEGAYQGLFGATLRQLAQIPADKKAFICCAAGKDRTGILIALFGYLLGVSPSDILSDYLISSGRDSLAPLVPLVLENARKISRIDIDEELAIEILGTSPDYLNATYEVIEREFGNIDGYIEHIGLTETDVDALRLRWLVK